jgi:pilus assembly protein Flp/PilA
MLTQLYVKALVYLTSLKNEEGQGMAEYGLILALVAVLCAVGFTYLEDQINLLMTAVGGKLTAN